MFDELLPPLPQPQSVRAINNNETGNRENGFNLSVLYENRLAVGG